MDKRGRDQGPGSTTTIASEQYSVTKHMNNLMGKLMWVVGTVAALSLIHI